MDEKKRNIVVMITFILFFTLSSFCITVHEQKESSITERRQLASLPTPSIETLVSTKFMKDFEDYALDQFPFRENFRQLKALTQTYVFRQKDNNGIYIAKDVVSKIEYPLNERSIVNAANKLTNIYDQYLLESDTKVYYSIVPDKNYYLASSNGFLSMDYEYLERLMQDNVHQMEYIPIFDCLSIEDYYGTDTHWRQERLEDVVKQISTKMNFSSRLTKEYETHTFSPFYGVYYGQAALPVKPDTLIYLSNKAIDNSKVFHGDTQSYTNVYELDNLDSKDSYEVFLSGASPILTIENPESESKKELVIFRDSFGSSLAPLFIEAYRKITLIDLRYISSDYVGEFIEFTDQDVLFLYSTLVLNHSTMLK